MGSITRRSFFKLTGAALASSVMYEFVGQSPAMAAETSKAFKLVDTQETPTVCCYCSGGCGTVVSTRGAKLINVEGDPCLLYTSPSPRD